MSIGKRLLALEATTHSTVLLFSWVIPKGQEFQRAQRGDQSLRRTAGETEAQFKRRAAGWAVDGKAAVWLR